jgi:hypothetical protein
MRYKYANRPNPLPPFPKREGGKFYLMLVEKGYRSYKY